MCTDSEVFINISGYLLDKSMFHQCVIVCALLIVMMHLTDHSKL